MTTDIIGRSGEPGPRPNETVWIGADGKREYPCWCGATHRGDYGFYDWMHHNCFHSEPLVEVDPDLTPGYLMCPGCGLTFLVAGSPVADAPQEGEA